MNYTKLGNFEAICLIVVLFVNHIVLNLPQMILDNARHCLYIKLSLHFSLSSYLYHFNYQTF